MLTNNLLSGLNADKDAASLLRNLATVILVVTMVLALVMALNGLGMRPSVYLSGMVAVSMLGLVRKGHVTAAAYVMCWGLLGAAGTAINTFGLRSTGGLLIPMAIMSGGWLLGRLPATMLAAAGSVMSLWGYMRHINNPAAASPPISIADVLGHFAIFLVTAILAAAMAATLRQQLKKVNALAASLQEANATLEERVAERSAQLVSMEKKVMDTEKLTSLGAMVAGISHELNTPLGNALTVSTTVEAHVHDLAQKAEAGQLTRSALSEFITSTQEMSALITQSVTRAAGLVASFKQIAVDQTSEQQRSFQLDHVVADNVAALRPSIRNAGVDIEVNIPADIECNSYPGPLGQIVTNLLQNAVLHGFDGKEHGRVEITAMVQGDKVCLEVIDDGWGMEPQVQARVFEPFFTTRLGRGGSGLGLSVSHRIASSVLGGELTVQSQPGHGSRFMLTFLKHLPPPV